MNSCLIARLNRIATDVGEVQVSLSTGAILAVLDTLKDDKMTMGSKTILRAALLIAASVGVSGCVYDVGLSYASDEYYDGGYACDVHGSYDAYDDCDYMGRASQISALAAVGMTIIIIIPVTGFPLRPSRAPLPDARPLPPLGRLSAMGACAIEERAEA